MRKTVALVWFCAAVAGAQNRAGFTPLFNGRDLSGWEMHWGKDWKAGNGALMCDASERSWLSTSGSYSDYVLRLEFKGAERVNSGVFLRSEREGQPHITGYELQIWDYQPAGFNTGSLVGALKAEPVKIIPNDWNKYEITAEGSHFVIVLNGKTILDGSDSKHAAGVIGFQCQPENPIMFRNIEIKELKKKHE